MTKEQQEAQKLIDSIYTPEKKLIWNREMDKAGKEFIDGKLSFDNYMVFRAKLRERLGYPV